MRIEIIIIKFLNYSMLLCEDIKLYMVLEPLNNS